jgi:hypothetical protein
MAKPTLISVFEKLESDAMCESILRRSAKHAVEQVRHNGGEIPDWAKPGALLNKLTSEERDILKTLTSDITRNERVEPWQINDEKKAMGLTIWSL